MSVVDLVDQALVVRFLAPRIVGFCFALPVYGRFLIGFVALERPLPGPGIAAARDVCTVLGAWNAGAAAPCTGTTGNVRREPLLPSSSDVVIAYGVGTTIGHKAFEIASRMRWPVGKTHEVRCIVMLRA
jgi:hypothetical protein